MKIDVQGAELKVISGLDRILKKGQVRRIILEYTPWMLMLSESDPTELLFMLERRNFKLFIIDEINEKLVAAKPNDISLSVQKSSDINMLVIPAGCSPISPDECAPTGLK